MKKVYFISGLGADKRIFSFLDLSFCEPVFIDWITPLKNESLESYALRLRKQIPDISQKMLTSTLKSLEADGYVTRKAYAEVPPRVEYSLTPRAETLIPILDHLIEWALDNMAVILKDRDKAAG